MTDTEIQAAFDKSLGPMVKESAALIAGDVRDIIDDKKMFDSADPEIGDPLTAVTPLRGTTIDFKKAQGSTNPYLARYRTGQLYESIRGQANGLEGIVTADDDPGVQQQTGEGVYGGTKRPFFGVSQRALEGVQKIVDKAGEAITAALDSSVTTVTITINRS